MKFWQLSRNFFDKRPKTYRWMSQNDGKKFFFQKISLLVSIPMYTKMQFWRARRNIFRQKSPNFSLDVQENGKKYNFFKNELLPLKMSFGCVGLSFDNPTENFNKTTKKFRSTSEKDDFFSQKNFFKIFPMTLRTQFWQLSPNLLGRKAKNLPLIYQ